MAVTPPSARRHLNLPAVLPAAHVARRWIADFANHLPHDRLIEVQLILSELVTYSIEYGGSAMNETITLFADSNQARLQITVFDDGRAFLPVGDGGPTAPALQLVVALADDVEFNHGSVTATLLE